jgi:glutamate synthase domain-containing protein 3
MMAGVDKKTTIDAKPNGCRLYHRELNKKIWKAIRDGYKYIVLKNVNGQRFIGAGIRDDITIEVFGDAGLDLGVFFQGKQIIVHGSSEYLLGNTLNGGELVVYGDSWDITGMGARDGRIFVMGNGGSRVGIHMKEYKDKKPIICYGGKVKQYCGEYMAGGIIVVLGLDFKEAIIDPKKPIDRDNINPTKIKNAEEPYVQSDLAGGIHGGVIYVRGEVPDEYLGVYATKEKADQDDRKVLQPIIERFCELFNCPQDLIWEKEFTKVRPISSRPFGKHYSTVPI